MALFLMTTSAAIALSPFRQRFVSASLPDPADDLLAPEFPQVIGCVAGAILRFALPAERANLTGQFGRRESAG
jgi:hypothetical protein